MMKSAFLISLFFVTLFAGCKKSSSHRIQSSRTDVHSILQTMPDQDRAVLDSFFQLLVRDYDFSYTLFGNKPISMACYSSQVTLCTFYHPTEFLTFENGWELWRHYASCFPSNEFILKRSRDNRGVLEIFLINKRHALQVISNHLDTFQEILNRCIDPQQLLQQLCCSQQDIMEILNNDATLLGILLGYGKINSANFERKVNICNHLNAKMTPPFSAHQDMKSLLPVSRNLVSLYDNGTFCYPSEKDCLPSSQDTSLTEELNDILSHEDTFEVYGSDFFLDKIIAPVFVARKDSPETEKLHEDYLATKQKLHQAYLQRSFLEVTLNQWMDPQ